MKSLLRAVARPLLIALALALSTGCASAEVAGTPPESANAAAVPADEGVRKDPLEKMNRAVFRFNQKVDKYFFKPVSEGYVKLLPRPVRTGIKNIFANLWEPTTIVNDLLQGKFSRAALDTTRFVVNSTMGLLGIFDVATRFELYRHDEDFGQTFAVWGIPSGPYLVLPFLGPSNIRDATGTAIRMVYTDPVSIVNEDTIIPATMRLVDLRARLLGTEDILAQQLDPYLFFRESYRQLRRDLIHDGSPPIDDAQRRREEEIFEQELFDEE